ncbi:hypothetical protein V0288_05425 [Pannus brasiliensis CCIBt3594]|uniref:Uncharacterized protein n=1 Tax=Pannus brasiliensis CCIBt3594 TaxID=1427578 RepID=A0AAW9QTA2_9CHRO
MIDRASFLGKILILSAAISVAIKYLAPFLPVSPTPLNAICLVLAPFTVLTIALWRRSFPS